MFGDYLKQQEDEAAQVTPSEPPATVKRRHGILGKSANRIGPVRMEFLLPEYNKLFESGKKERRSYGAHSGSDDRHTGEWTQTCNTIPETSCTGKPHEPWSPAVMVTPATPIKPTISSQQDGPAPVSEAEKENFTPLKVQKVSSVATPVASREPLSLICGETPLSKVVHPQNLEPSSVPLGSQNGDKGRHPLSCHAKPELFRSRLYAVSHPAGFGTRAQHGLLPSIVPVHPMIAAAEQQNSKQPVGQQNVQSVLVPPGIPHRKSPETALSSGAIISNSYLNSKAQLHFLKPACEPKPVISLERVPNLSVDPVVQLKQDVKCSVVPQKEDFVRIPSETEECTLKVEKQAAQGDEALAGHPVEMLESRAEPVVQRCAVNQEVKTPGAHEVHALKNESCNKNSVSQLSVEKATKSDAKENQVFQVPRPVSNVQNKRSASTDQIIVNGKSYSVLSLLGRGGSSNVYQVLDPSSSRLLAVKCVNLSEIDDSICSSYLNEIKLLEQLQDGDCVIRMYDFEHRKQDRMLYVVMEKGDTDLSKLIKDLCRTKKISAAMIVYYWIEMLEAVSFIHKRGTIHSDLKPSNFLLVSGRLKLIDFGIASSIQGDMTSVIKDNMTGTYNYISPEALCGTGGGDGQRFKITYKSDVWSLGCILYNLVYGHTPFQNIQGQFQKLNAIVNSSHKIPFPVPPIEQCPPVLIQALQACLIRNPKERASVEDLLRFPYLGHVGPERAVLSHIVQLIASVELDDEDPGNSKARNVLKAVKNLIIDSESSLPFLQLKK